MVPACMVTGGSRLQEENEALQRLVLEVAQDKEQAHQAVQRVRKRHANLLAQVWQCRVQAQHCCSAGLPPSKGTGSENASNLLRCMGDRLAAQRLHQV